MAAAYEPCFLEFLFFDELRVHQALRFAGPTGSFCLVPERRPRLIRRQTSELVLSNWMAVSWAVSLRAPFECIVGHPPAV